MNTIYVYNVILNVLLVKILKVFAWLVLLDFSQLRFLIAFLVTDNVETAKILHLTVLFAIWIEILFLLVPVQKDTMMMVWVGIVKNANLFAENVLALWLALLVFLVKKEGRQLCKGVGVKLDILWIIINVFVKIKIYIQIKFYNYIFFLIKKNYNIFFLNKECAV